MELTKQHREALIAALDKAKQELAVSKKIIANPPSGTEHWCEIDDYLAQQRINIIEKALIENDIDY